MGSTTRKINNIKVKEGFYMLNSDKIKIEMMGRKLSEAKDLYESLSDNTKNEIEALQKELTGEVEGLKKIYSLKYFLNMGDIAASEMVDIINIS